MGRRLLLVIAALSMAGGASGQALRPHPAPGVRSLHPEGLSGNSIGRANAHGAVGGPTAKVSGISGSSVSRRR